MDEKTFMMRYYSEFNGYLMGHFDIAFTVDSALSIVGGIWGLTDSTSS